MNSKKIIYSNYFLIIIFFILLSSFLINIFAFESGKILDSYWIKDGISINSKYSYLGFISIFFGWLGELTGTIGSIFLARKNKVFLPIVLASIVFSMINQIIIGVFFTFITYIFTFVLVLITFFEWNNSEDKEINKASILIQGLIFISWIVFGFLFYSLILPHSEIKVYNSIDVISSSMSLPCWWLILRKRKIGFIGFIINDSLYVIMFSIVGLYVVAIGFALYVFISLLTLMSYDEIDQ